MMEKRNEITAGNTPCRFCNEKSIVVDPLGVPRCGDHLHDSGSTIKSAAVTDLPEKHAKPR